MKSRHKRLALVVGGLAGLSLAAYLVFSAMNDNLMLFISPSDVAQHKNPTDKAFRLGGLVEEGSVSRGPDGVTVHFVVTDNANKINVTYKGILPDLFREGQGIVANGKLTPEGHFVASEVLAKHDEKYMPPEVAAALKKTESTTVTPR